MRHVERTAMIALGWALLIPGLIFVVLPPPFAFGIFMVIPAVAILVAYSKFMRRLVQAVRARYHTVNVAMHAFEARLPAFLGRSLKRTNPAAIARAVRRRRRERKAEREAEHDAEHDTGRASQ